MVSAIKTPSILIIGYDASVQESLESSYARAFEHLGYTVKRWHPSDALARSVRLGLIGQLAAQFIHIEPWLRKANEQLLRFIRQKPIDFILVIATHGIRAGTLAQIKVLQPNCLIYCLYPDSPHNLDHDRIQCLPLFDRVLTSSPAWVSAFATLGAKQVDYLPFAADTLLHQPNITTESTQLGFIGTWRPERETILEALSDYDLKIWGSNYWKRRTRSNSPLRQAWTGTYAVGQNFANICGQTTIMLNIMDAVTYPGPNMRVFEQPACRAFSLVSRSQAILGLFTEDENIVCFDSITEAREKIDYYLAHPAERQQIAQASYEFITQGGHTYLDRAQQLIKWYDNNIRN